jgi:predicted metal-dependent enzyme (double-stranded beta helix superfamily)
MTTPLNVEATSAATPQLLSFVTRIEQLLDCEREPHAIAQSVRVLLAELVSDASFLTPAQCEPDPQRYRVHLLTVAPSRRFSVTALVWLPGQVTPIHDHVCWCVVGVVQGTEREQRYSLRESATGERWLVPLGDEAVPPGHTAALVPPDENIHRVRNAGDTLAISIHVYGDDLTLHPTSINQCFDDVPVRAGDHSGVAVPWRRVTPSEAR